MWLIIKKNGVFENNFRDLSSSESDVKTKRVDRVIDALIVRVAIFAALVTLATFAALTAFATLASVLHLPDGLGSLLSLATLALHIAALFALTALFAGGGGGGDGGDGGGGVGVGVGAALALLTLLFPLAVPFFHGADPPDCQQIAELPHAIRVPLNLDHVHQGYV